MNVILREKQGRPHTYSGKKDSIRIVAFGTIRVLDSDLTDEIKSDIKKGWLDLYEPSVEKKKTKEGGND